MVTDLKAANTSVTDKLLNRKHPNIPCSTLEYFLCSNGECVTRGCLCDGFFHCRDQSDETEKLCKALYKSCFEGQWQCDYGACIPEEYRCDNRRDCWDGSDERNCPRPSKTTLQGSSDPSGKPCEVPQPANNRQIFNWNNHLSQLPPGSFVPHNDLVLVLCDWGYQFSLDEGLNNFTICSNGEWTPNIPQCIPCGMSSLITDNMTYTVNNIYEGQLGQFPWLAQLYFRDNNAWILRCDATLISTRVILTSAVCVHLNNYDIKIPVDELRVIVGKRNADYDVAEKTEQSFKVKETLAYPGYTAGPNLIFGNIALVLLDGPVQFNDHVMPACLDYSHTYDMDIANDNALVGYLQFVRLNSTEALTNTTEITSHLRYSQIHVLSHQACRIAAELSYGIIEGFADDMFCVNSGTATEEILEDNKSGVCLTIPFDGQHYVSGLSIGSGSEVIYFAYLVNISYHMDWMIDNTRQLVTRHL